MIIFFGINSYLIVGLIIGIVICKIKGKEWCISADAFDSDFFENNAQGVLLVSTFFWGFIVGCTILFSPFLIIYYFITYIAKKLQE